MTFFSLPHHAVSADLTVLPISTSDLSVRTNTWRSDGVLSARPDPDDRQILSLIAQNNISSLQEYSTFLKNSVSYRKQGKTSQWVNWRDTLRNGYADCKGFSLLNHAFLSFLGYEPKILVLRSAFYSHAVCVFKVNGRFFIFDNETLRSTRCVSLTELARYLITKYEGSTVLEVDGTSRKVSLVLTQKTM